MSTPTFLEQGFEKVLTPFQQFIQNQTTSSIMLIACTLFALVIANSPLFSWYETTRHLPIGFFAGNWNVTMSLTHWVNDGLMSLFFFLIGMEIKREMLVGEMKEIKYLIPVSAAALGGMLIPASIFYSLNADTIYAQGWGIPMATDTAFAIGILAMVGNKIPKAAFVFLTALAIIDDIGAILVIAIFYSQQINFLSLVISASLLVLLILFNLLGIRRPVLYILFGALVWVAMLDSGIHATVAGILVAFTVPARPKRQPGWFIRRTRELLRHFERIESHKQNVSPMLGEAEQHAVVDRVQDAAEKTTTPLRRWESALETPVALFVIPIFALVNAGIPFNISSFPELIIDTLSLGIILGLVLGKVVGISLFTWLSLYFSFGRLPADINMQHIIGLGLLGGMGFTMSIFITNLGFDGQALQIAKTSILVASFVAGLSGYLWLKYKS